jgi:hypothetical protein
MSFNLLTTLWQRRMVRAGLGLVVVNQDERLVFSCDSGQNGSVEVHFDRARLDKRSIEAFAGVGVRLPAAWGPISYLADRSRNSAAGDEPCSTRIELRIDSKVPGEIRISQLSDPGLNRRRHLQIMLSDVEVVANMLTQLPGDSDLAPGCRKLLKVDNVSHSTSVDVTARVAENSAVHFTVYPLTADSTPWGNAQGSFTFDLGGGPKLNATDLPPFQARAVIIRSLGSGVAPNAPPVLRARSEAGGPLLTVSNPRVFSDHFEVNVAGKGNVELDGVEQTTNFLKFLQENLITSALLLAANAALLAWVARLVFKAPARTP